MDVLDMFEQTGAVQTGHFLLTSGRHSGTYFQCARVLQYPEKAAALCAELARPFTGKGITVVAAPAIGGIIVAHETAKALGARAVFAEREQGEMRLRRGFEIDPGEKVLVVEDVVTTGGSVREVLALVRSLGGSPVGVAFLADRSGGRVDFGLPKHALLTLEVKSFTPEECPLCKKGLPIQKPGSRRC